MSAARCSSALAPRVARFVARIAGALLATAVAGCVGGLRHAKQPEPLPATRSIYPEFIKTPRLAGEQLVGIAVFVGEDDFEQSSARMALLHANGVGSARSCSLGCGVSVRRDSVAAAEAIIAADGRFIENLGSEVRPSPPSDPR